MVIIHSYLYFKLPKGQFLVIHGDMYSPHQLMFFWCLGHLKVWLWGAVPQVGFLHHLVIPLYKACAVVWLTVIRGSNWLFLLSKFPWTLAWVGSGHVPLFQYTYTFVTLHGCSIQTFRTSLRLLGVSVHITGNTFLSGLLRPIDISFPTLEVVGPSL